MNADSLKIDARDVYKKIQNHEDFILVDVRTPDEYGRGKILGSINIPLDEISTQIAAKVPDKNTPIIVHCLSGSRSMQAAAILGQMGYTNVSDMISGMMAWRVYKLPEEKSV